MVLMSSEEMGLLCRESAMGVFVFEFVEVGRLRAMGDVRWIARGLGGFSSSPYISRERVGSRYATCVRRFAADGRNSLI